jgi:hypothetical protein
MIHVSKAIEYVGIGSIVAFLMISTIPPPTNATEIIYDKNADLPICVYKVIQDCKVRSGLICEVDTTIDPCLDILKGFSGADENYRPDTDNFIVPEHEINEKIVGCWDDGYEDGQKGPFDRDRYDECKNKGSNRYFPGFQSGCYSVDNNTLEICQPRWLGK